MRSTLCFCRSMSKLRHKSPLCLGRSLPQLPCTAACASDRHSAQTIPCPMQRHTSPPCIGQSIHQQSLTAACASNRPYASAVPCPSYARHHTYAWSVSCTLEIPRQILAPSLALSVPMPSQVTERAQPACLAHASAVAFNGAKRPAGG